MVASTLLEARVDWVSCSGKNDPKGEALTLLAATRLQQSWEAGDKVSYFGRNGYTGKQCGHWKLATGPQGVIVQVGGDEADRYILTLAHYAAHFSRVDYCVTATFDGPPVRPSDDIYRMFEEREEAGDDKYKVKELREVHGGSGVELGARTSAYCGRVYDKHQESKGLYPPNTWRYEVEMKRHASELEQMYVQTDKGRADQALEIVSTIFERWQVPVPWESTTPVHIGKAPRRVRDYEKALKWLRTQVAPTIEWLIASGREGAALEALNLKPAVD